MNYTDEQLIQRFVESIPSKPANTKQLFAIGFVGLVGSGKSYIAQKISKKLDLYIASNDKIRRFLNELGFAGDSPIQETLQKIAESSSCYLYKNKISHILDADLIKFHDVAIKNAQEFGARIYIIHVVCPEEIILKRLENRSHEVQKDNSKNLSRADKETYFERKELHSTLALPEFFNTLDSSQNVDMQIENLILKLKTENVI